MSMKLIITSVLFFIITISYSQTKAERKVKVTTISSAMYDGSESEKANELYSAGEEKYLAEDYKEAIKLYNQALDEDKSFVEAYDNIGLCYRRLGDFKNAIKYYNKSLELYPEGSMAHQNLAVVYGIQKEYAKAISEYEIMQKNNPDDAEGYYGTINNYLNMGKYKEAIKNAIKTLEIYEATDSPYTYEAQYLLGLSYYYDKDIGNAKIYIAQAKKSGFKVNQALLDELGIK